MRHVRKYLLWPLCLLVVSAGAVWAAIQALGRIGSRASPGFLLVLFGCVALVPVITALTGRRRFRRANAMKASASAASIAARFGTIHLPIAVAAFLAVSCNTAPLADAGVDQYVVTGSLVTLNGSGSNDPDGSSVSYTWSFVSMPEGSAAVLSDPTAVSPTFTADRDGTYVLSLVVSDGELSSAADTVTVTARTPVAGPCAFVESANAAGQGVVLQPDGRIVTVSTDGLVASVLQRFNADGSGAERLALFQGVAGDIARQADGRLLVVGRSQTLSGADPNVILLRFEENGVLDTSFGVGGTATFDGGHSEQGYALAVQPDGKILVAGFAYDYSDGDVLLLRFNPDGSLDQSFGTGGVVVYDSGKFEFGGDDVALQPDGKILVTGTVTAATQDALLLRFNVDGTLDNSFGANGVVTYDAGEWDNGNGVALQPDGRIVVTGARAIGGQAHVLVLRYDVTGALDTTFADAGIGTYGLGRGSEVALQPDGRIVIAGNTILQGVIFNVALVASYNPDGTPDLAFGTDGVVTYNGTRDGADGVGSLAFTADGGIVAVGASNFISSPYGSRGDFLLMKLYDVCQ